MRPRPRPALRLRPPQQQRHEDRSHLWVSRSIRLLYLCVFLCQLESVFCASFFSSKDKVVLSCHFQVGSGLCWLQQRRCPFSASPRHGRLQIQHGGINAIFLLLSSLLTLHILSSATFKCLYLISRWLE